MNKPITSLLSHRAISVTKYSVNFGFLFFHALPSTSKLIQICPIECDEDAETTSPFISLCYHSEGCPGHQAGHSDRRETPQCSAAAEHT